MQRSDQLLTRATLIKDAWHHKFVPETSRVNVHMGRLRANVEGPHEAPIIRNVRGEGYIQRDPGAFQQLPRLRGLKQRELTQTNSNNV
jgi:DNA-binding response OmpR family regulator